MQCVIARTAPGRSVAYVFVDSRCPHPDHHGSQAVRGRKGRMMKHVGRSCRFVLPAIVSSMAIGCSSGQDSQVAGPPPEVPGQLASAKLASVQRDFSLSRSGVRVPVVARGSARAVERRKDGLAPVFDASATIRAEVTLPTHADRPATLIEPETGIAIRFGLQQVAHSEGVPVDGMVVYKDIGTGADAFHRPTPDGMEDFVRLEHAPSRPELRYQVDVTRVAGVREISNVVEFLDATGAPRLRVTAPWLVDAAGREVALRVGVEGCAADRDPRAPFDRPVVAPASPNCQVVVSWAGQDVSYPVLVDPAWTMAGNLALARTNHGAARMADGRVLVAGGEPGGTASLTAEIFDPVTKTWAMTGNLIVSRGSGSDQSLVLLNNGKVLLPNGFNQTNHEVYDPAAGTWAATGPVWAPRGAGKGVLLNDGKVLVAGGFYPENTRQSELYDPALNTYAKTAGMLAKGRYDHAFVKLKDGRALVAGGFGTQGGDTTATVEIYDPATGQWSPAAPMSIPRGASGYAVLPDGRVVVAGGSNGSFPPVQDSTEVYDPSTNTWAAGPKLKRPRSSFDMRQLGDGRLLLVAGYDGTTYPSATELFDLSTGSQDTKAQSGPRWTGPSLTVLEDGRVLSAGGGNITPTSELFAFVVAGGSCSLGNECASGICVQGMCCDTPCDGTCVSCRASEKASGADGSCGPVKSGIDPKSTCGLCQACSGSGSCSPVPAGSDPKEQCLDSGSPECGTDGECDGAGACRKYATSSGCTPRPCVSEDDCKSGYCVDGICCDSACAGDGDSKCVACSAGKKGSGIDGECGPILADTDPDDDCAQGPNYPKSCLADGMCDGAGKCRIFAKDTVGCGDTQCISGNAVGLLCNGAGTCMQATAGCEPYVCKGTGCLQSCQDGNDCAQGRYCTAQGTCEIKGVNGTVCISGLGCQSGYCADGVCCDSPCTGQCEACNVDPNAGACVPVQGPPIGARPACAGTDPVCTGQCDGVNRASCHYAATTIACGTPTCANGVAHSSHCDNQGACVAAEDKACGAYACGAMACKTTCTGNADCAQGYGCATEGVCVPGGASKNGEQCTEGQECQSGFCADGVCCNAACQGQCEACNVEPNAGSCSPVIGEPVGKRTLCVTTDKDCKGACDGVNRAACGYPGSDTPCGTPACTAGVARGSQCNGKGACVAAEDKACGAYACGDARCKTSCKVLADCAQGYTCTAEGSCAPGSSCSEDLTRTIGVSGEQSCTPFLCDPGTGRCRVVCSMSSECATAYVCDPSSKTCIPAAQSAPPSEDAGCGCRTAGSSTPGMAGLLGLALASLFAARRRRAGTRLKPRRARPAPCG